MNEVLKAKNLWRRFHIGTNIIEVLRGSDLSVFRGEWLAILGRSGSGKSTLLHLLGGLDSPDVGEIWFEDQSLSVFSELRLDRYRNERVGFVFQFYHLLPELNAMENVMLAQMIRTPISAWPRGKAAARRHAAELLERVGLKDRMTHKPTKLSGGERQRVAIARALGNSPDILLADEPTGNLDGETSAAIIDLFRRLHGEGQTIVMVTHDVAIANVADRQLTLSAGLLGDDGRSS